MKIPILTAAIFLTGTLAGVAVWQNNASAETQTAAETATAETTKAAATKAAATKRKFPPDNSTAKYTLTDAQWRKVLTKQQYYVLRQEGTDAPFTGSYKYKGDGAYRCVGCNNILFSDDTQFDSKTGWPSFWKPLRAQSVRVVKDVDGEREEVECARCGSHLGHVFNDGPQPTGLRYCMNQSALNFAAAKK